MIIPIYWFLRASSDSLLHSHLSHMAVHHLHHLHYHRLHLLLLAQYFILNWRLGSSANSFLHRPFPFLPDWFHGLSDRLTILGLTLLNGWIGKCVRLNRLLVGFRMHFKSLHFHSFIYYTAGQMLSVSVCVLTRVTQIMFETCNPTWKSGHFSPNVSPAQDSPTFPRTSPRYSPNLPHPGKASWPSQTMGCLLIYIWLAHCYTLLTEWSNYSGK